MINIRYTFIIYFIIITILAFTLCGIDKKRAINHAWRISEKTLLLSGVFGGCFGLGLGMLFFHHKTKHTKFRLLVPLECTLWLLAILYFFLK